MWGIDPWNEKKRYYLLNENTKKAAKFNIYISNAKK